MTIQKLILLTEALFSYFIPKRLKIEAQGMCLTSECIFFQTIKVQFSQNMSTVHLNKSYMTQKKKQNKKKKKINKEQKGRRDKKNKKHQSLTGNT